MNFCLLLLAGCLFGTCRGLRASSMSRMTKKSFAKVGNTFFDESSSTFQGFDCEVLSDNKMSDLSDLNAIGSFSHLGDISPSQPSEEEFEEMKKKSNYQLNVGRATEALRKDLPMVFSKSDLDFSVFAETISVTDHRSNRAEVPKSIYVAAVKSLKLAGHMSTLFPSMNVKKIEYIECEEIIQCHVDVVLPDSVRVDGQAVWEGMMYFGLDVHGKINSHVFDRRITNFKTNKLQSQLPNMPWLRPQSSTWRGELVLNIEDDGCVTLLKTDHSPQLGKNWADLLTKKQQSKE